MKQPGFPLMLCVLLAVATMARADDPVYPHELRRWQEVAVPARSDAGCRRVWLFAANYSTYEWRVSVQDGEPQAQLKSEVPAVRPRRPDFTPRADGLGLAPNVIEVADGWLVGFNQGEFGAALYWFSRDGENRYKVSAHQVVGFFPRADGSVDAAEGLAHLGLSRGTLIRVVRLEADGRWQAETLQALPGAPYAGVRCRDGSLLLVLASALVRIDVDGRSTTLLGDVPWSGLYPNSCVLSPDERQLFVGMRQFVGEFDLAARRLRLLVPAAAFLNRLPEEEQDRIRKQYGG